MKLFLGRVSPESCVRKFYPDDVDKPKTKKSTILSKDYCRRDIDHTGTQSYQSLAINNSTISEKIKWRSGLLAGLRLAELINNAF